MKLSVLAEELNVALKRCSAVLPRKSKLPITENVLVSVLGDGNAYLKATDLETEVIVLVPVWARDESGEFLVSKEDIKVLSKFKGDIEIEVTDDLVIYKGKNTLKSQVKHDVSEFPDIWNGVADNLFEIDAVELKKKFKIKNMAAKDLTRRMLCGIHFNRNSIETVDGFRVARIKCDFHNEQPFIMPIETVKSLEKTIDKNTELLKFSKTENRVVINCRDFVLTFRPIDSSFFNVDNILNEDPYYEVEVNKKSLLDFTNTVVALKTKAPMKLTLEDSKLTCSINSENHTLEKKLDVENDNLKTLEIHFNPKYLQEALKCIDEEQVTLGLTSEVSPVIISTPGEVYLVLPIRVSK